MPREARKSRSARKRRARWNCAKCGKKNAMTFHRDLRHFLCDEDLMNFVIWRGNLTPDDNLEAFLEKPEL